MADVLYQKGASFSATLDDTNGHVMDNSVDNSVPGDPSSGTQSQTQRRPRLEGNIESHVAPSREYFDSMATIASSGSSSSTGNNEMFYSKDMSIFDDVNNNRLNLPMINDRFTVRAAPELPPDEMIATEVTELTPTRNMNETSNSALNMMASTVPPAT